MTLLTILGSLFFLYKEEICYCFPHPVDFEKNIKKVRRITYEYKIKLIL